MMDEPTKKRLESVRENAELTRAEERMKSGWYAEGPKFCLAPGCGKRILKPRMLRQQDGRRYITLCFCTQECHDKWNAQFHLPGPHFEKYNQEGILIGYVVPRRGFVPIEEVP